MHWDQPRHTGEPSPLLTVAPAHVAGWNKITVGRAVWRRSPLYFGDAQIAGAAAPPTALRRHDDAIGRTTGRDRAVGRPRRHDELWSCTCETTIAIPSASVLDRSAGRRRVRATTIRAHRAPDEALAPCVERPTDLPRPPTGALPCELLPPGFTPPR